MDSPDFSEGKSRESWASFLVQVAVMLICVIALRSLLFQPFSIPSASMVPTLQIGDFVGVTKYDYGYSRFSFPLSLPFFRGRIFGAEPARGDVAVFRYTQDPKVDFIKRIVGLPGDRILVQGSRLYINGHEVPRQDPRPYNFVDQEGSGWSGTRWREALPSSLPGGADRTHEILQVRENGPANDTLEYIVPPGCFFAMGDDRDDSLDSRFQGGRSNGACAAPAVNDFLKSGEKDLGFVPMENLVGRARWVFFSFDSIHPFWQFWHWPSEIRWSRLFRSIP